MKLEELKGKKIAVFDLEIKKSIEQCSKGWNSHDEMGISCLCLYDYFTDRYRVFDDHNQAECLEILRGYEIVVGYNITNFDWKVVNSNWNLPNLVGFTERKSRDFDILREIWKSKGLNPDVFSPRTHGGTKLDDVAFDTLGMRKTLNGAEAPKYYQQGRIGEVIDYCLEEVRIERLLFEFIVVNGYVIRYNKRILINFSL